MNAARDDGGTLLPGEAAPLVYHRARGPVTAEEALGVSRRHRRAENLKTRRRAGEEPPPVPAALPSWDVAKQPILFRLPPRLVAYSLAKCELEATNLTAIIEEFLGGWIPAAPRAPVAARRAQEHTYARLTRLSLTPAMIVQLSTGAAADGSVQSHRRRMS